MAKPKEKFASQLSGAFQEKCKRERKRLKSKLAKLLQTDIERLIDEGEYNDLQLNVENRTVDVNKFILKSRSPEFFAYLLRRHSAESTISLNNSDNSNEFVDLLRQLCIKEHTQSAVEQLTEMMSIYPKESSLSQNSNRDRVTLKETGNLQMSENSSTAENNFIDSPHFENNTIRSMDDDCHHDELSTIQNNISNHLMERQDEENTLSEIIKQSYKLNLPHETCCELGEDLLRQFLQETDADCIISVEGHQIKCQRCILSSRCEYFSAMLSGNWIESDQNVIALEGLQFPTLEQVLLYLYGGVIDLTESCSLVDLLKAADMFGIIGLKDVVDSYLLSENCHFFHKPCPTCQSKVSEALLIAVSYNLDDLCDKCLKWMSKNFCKVWPTKSFASLPDEVLQMSFDATVSDLNAESVMDVMFDCQKITSTSPRLKWTEPLLDLTNKLMEASIEYTSKNFIAVLSSERFLSFGKHNLWSMGLLENIFPVVIKSLPADKACGTYEALCRLIEYSRLEMCGWAEDFRDFVTVLFAKCEEYLKLYIQQVVKTPDWNLLSTDQQASLMKAASYVPVGKTLPKRSNSPSFQKKSVGAINEVKTSHAHKFGSVKTGSKTAKSSQAALKKTSSGYQIKLQFDRTLELPETGSLFSSQIVSNAASGDTNPTTEQLTMDAGSFDSTSEIAQDTEAIQEETDTEQLLSQMIDNDTHVCDVRPGSYFLGSEYSACALATQPEATSDEIPDLDSHIDEMCVSDDTVLSELKFFDKSNKTTSCHNAHVADVVRLHHSSQDNISEYSGIKNYFFEDQSRQGQQFYVQIIPIIDADSIQFRLPE